MATYTDRLSSPLGDILLSSDGTALTGLWFVGQKYIPELSPVLCADLPVFRETRRWLDLYFQGAEPDFMPPLSLSGSPFRQAVWAQLRQIPYGTVTTYGRLAEALRQNGIAASAQAVGGAVGHNPVSILVPCHRVIGANGSLTGYAGGLEKKQFLLTLEHAAL